MKIIDLTLAAVPFSPDIFFGPGYRIVEEFQDKRSDSLSDINFGSVTYITGIQLDERITCEEELCRLMGLDDYLLCGASIAHGLWVNHKANKDSGILEYLRLEQGINRIDFGGDIISDPYCDQNILALAYGADTSLHQYEEWRLFLCSLTTWPFRGYFAALSIP